MSESAPILTLEPLIDGVTDALINAGWTLSGLQKTTSHQFEGRWEGESTRSAYLFFHHERFADDVSLDVFLDETTRGLSGNLALVVDLAPLADIGDVREAMRGLVAVAAGHLGGERRRTPVSLRLRVADSRDPVDQAETQLRFKARIPARVIGEGAAAVRSFAGDVVADVERLLDSGSLDRFRKD